MSSLNTLSTRKLLIFLHNCFVPFVASRIVELSEEKKSSSFAYCSLQEKKSERLVGCSLLWNEIPWKRKARNGTEDVFHTDEDAFGPFETHTKSPEWHSRNYFSQQNKTSELSLRNCCRVLLIRFYWLNINKIKSRQLSLLMQRSESEEKISAMAKTSKLHYREHLRLGENSKC